MNEILSKLSPESRAKYIAIRRRIIGHNPLVIRPLRPMHRAILSLQYASR